MWGLFKSQAERFEDEVSFREINLKTDSETHQIFTQFPRLTPNNSLVSPLTERQEHCHLQCKWDAGTNWQFRQTVNVYQNGNLCKLTRSLYWWLQSGGGTHKCLFVKKKEKKKKESSWCVLWVPSLFHCCNMGTKNDQMWICPCVNVCVFSKRVRRGFPITLFADPDADVIAGCLQRRGEISGFACRAVAFMCGVFFPQEATGFLETARTEPRVTGGRLLSLMWWRWKPESNSCVMDTQELGEEAGEAFRSTTWVNALAAQCTIPSTTFDSGESRNVSVKCALPSKVVVHSWRMVHITLLDYYYSWRINI